MRPLQMAEGGHPQPDQIRPRPQPIAVEEARFFLIFDSRVGAADRVARLLQLGEGLRHPAAFGFPIRHRRHQFARRFHFLVDGGVVRNLHLVNRHAVGRHPDGPAHAVAPVGLRLLDHARDQVDVDLGKAQLAGVFVSPRDFLAVMGPAVDLENVIVKIFHSQAQARHSQVPDRFELVAGQRPRLAFESDFPDFVPRDQLFHPVGKVPQLFDRRGRTECRRQSRRSGLCAPPPWAGSRRSPVPAVPPRRRRESPPSLCPCKP